MCYQTINADGKLTGLFFIQDQTLPFIIPGTFLILPMTQWLRGIDEYLFEYNEGQVEAT